MHYLCSCVPVSRLEYRQSECEWTRQIKVRPSNHSLPAAASWSGRDSVPRSGCGMACVLMRWIRQGRDEHLSVLVAWVVSRERLLCLPAIPRIELLVQKEPHADVRCVFYASVRRKQPSGVYITSTRRAAVPISLSLCHSWLRS